MHTDRKSILIVDDDEELCDLLAILLSSGETVIHLARSIAEARNVVERCQVDIIFLDLFLPDGYGLSLLDHWQEIHHSRDHPCTIIMSGFGNWQNYLSAFNHEVYYFLEKPFKVTKVKSLLDDALRKSELH